MKTKEKSRLKKRISIQKIVPIAFFSCILLSCTDMSLTEVVTGNANEKLRANTDQLAYSADALAANPIPLHKIDLYLEKGPAATGYLTVAIRSVASNLRIDSVAVLVRDLEDGSSWNTIQLSANASLIPGEKYRIKVMRSSPHDISGDYIAWRCSANNLVDAYTPGLSDVNPGRISDYAFRTYTDEFIDQEQARIESGLYVENRNARWQEFVAESPVNVTSVQLLLTVDPDRSNPFTDFLEIKIKGPRHHSNILDSVTYQIKIPTSSLHTGRHWNIFSVGGPLQRSRPFKISARRTGGPGYGNIYWHQSAGTQDLYLSGSTDDFNNPLVDYAFKTFSASGLDQQQISTTNRVLIDNTRSRFQMFTPLKQ